MNFSGTKVIKNAPKSKTQKENLKSLFFFWRYSFIQIVIEIKSPPTHRPETKSSIPKYRHKPTPEAIAIVQTGQTALATNGRKVKIEMEDKILIIFFEFMVLRLIFIKIIKSSVVLKKILFYSTRQ
jgi:hypothetical protein